MEHDSNFKCQAAEQPFLKDAKGVVNNKGVATEGSYSQRMSFSIIPTVNIVCKACRFGLG